jgi:hypothetical protein
MEENKNSPQSTDDSPQQEPQLNPPSTDELIADAEQPTTYNSQLTTPNDMEVHHHAHDPSAPHHKKNWKSYFWEFLMLFLAVFCGFLAEYQLEHKIERDREKQYIRSLIQDLKLDTARLNVIINHRLSRDEMVDSLSHLLSKSDASSYGSDIYYLTRYLTRALNVRFYSNDGTMQQLKNSGGLRLIRNQNITDSIIGYDVAIRSLLAQTQVENQILDDLRAEVFKIFDGRVFDTMMDDESNLSKPPGNPVFEMRKENVFPFYTGLHYVSSINKINRN